MPVSRTPIARLVLDPASDRLLTGLADKLGLTRSGVMRLALRRLAELERYVPANDADSGPEGKAAA